MICIEELQNKVNLAAEDYTTNANASSIAKKIHYNAKYALKNIITNTPMYDVAIAFTKTTGKAL